MRADSSVFNSLRGVLRLLFFILYALLMIGNLLISKLLHGTDIRRGIKIRQDWTRWFLPKIGVRMYVEGRIPEGPGIIMCNHRSYLDPAILACDTLFMPVSKAEVANWPIVGYAVKLSGVLFVKREKEESRKQTRLAVEQKVREGFSVLLFPEGTTHDEPTTAPFRPAIFNLAAEAGFPIMPVMLEYRDPEDYWIGKASFLPHFLHRFGKRNIDVFVRYGPAIKQEDPQQLLLAVKNWIDGELTKVRNSF
jgi:1-acyl-sn-glycerol-3-phosphate acyltransferase